MTTNAPPIDVAAEDSERIDLESDRYPEVAKKRHMARYEWARDVLRARFVRPGRVIDYACGTGYGSAILAEVAHEVLGRDKDPEAVRVANVRHSSTLVSFKVRDRIERHPGDFTPFDAVVSIETIEHLDPAAGYGPEQFLAECFKLVMPHGLLILSTPEKDALGKGVLRSKFHLVEFGQAELTKLVEDADFIDVQYAPIMPGFLCLVARRRP